MRPVGVQWVLALVLTTIAGVVVAGCGGGDDDTPAVACWGENGLGQVGDGGTMDRFAPREVVGLVDVVQIAAGCEHTCARRSDGSVACWGAGADGQLGAGFTPSGTTTYAMMPVELAA